jgi:hypothetical protein
MSEFISSRKPISDTRLDRLASSSYPPAYEHRASESADATIGYDFANGRALPDREDRALSPSRGTNHSQLGRGAYSLGQGYQTSSSNDQHAIARESANLTAPNEDPLIPSGLQFELRRINVFPKLNVGREGDPYEEEADHAAEQAMKIPEPAGRRQLEIIAPSRSTPLAERVPSLIRKDIDHIKASETMTGFEGRLMALRGAGQPLPESVRSFMEPRLGADFSQVRVHTDHEAVRMTRGVRAQVFTHGEDIYFGSGRYPGRDTLTAHELTHVLQQRGRATHGRGERARGGASPALAGRGELTRRVTGPMPNIQRVIEFRPPGPGEASAFGRRQEVLDRLNTQSPATTYKLVGNELHYDAVPGAATTTFDTFMRGFIDKAEVIPFRLITSSGLVSQVLPGGAIGFGPLLVDSFISGYLDIDDMLASDDATFQLQWVHILTERSNVPNYARRIGTDMSAQFPAAHQAGREAEADHLRGVIGDPTIKYVYDEDKPNGTHVVGFKSTEGYWVFKVFLRVQRLQTGGKVFVQTTDGRHISIEALKAERAAARPTPVAPSHLAPLP